MPHIKHLLAGKATLLLPVLYSCAISVLFFLPTNELPKVQFFAADKLVHGFIYFVLVNLWLYYLYSKNNFQFENKWILILLLTALLYGIIIEIFQGWFSASRSADFFDVVANFMGSLLGIFFFRKVMRKLNPKNFN